MVPFCLLNTLSWFMWTITYIVKYEFILPWDKNLVWIHYVFSKLKIAVVLIDHTNTLDIWRYVCAFVLQCMVTCHAIYMSDWRELLSPESCLFYTFLPVDCVEKYLRKKCLFFDHYVAECHKYRKFLSLCVDATFWPDLCFLQLFIPLHSSNLRCHFNN